MSERGVITCSPQTLHTLPIDDLIAWVEDIQRRHPGYRIKCHNGSTYIELAPTDAPTGDPDV